MVAGARAGGLRCGPSRLRRASGTRRGVVPAACALARSSSSLGAVLMARTVASVVCCRRGTLRPRLDVPACGRRARGLSVCSMRAEESQQESSFPPTTPDSCRLPGSLAAGTGYHAGRFLRRNPREAPLRRTAIHANRPGRGCNRNYCPCLL